MTIETRPVEAPVKTVGDVLRHAALLIEERGWHDNPYEYECSDGRLCAMGAIHMAALGSAEWRYTDDDALVQSAELAVLKHLPTDTVEQWNDERAGSARKVLSVLRAAAEEADRGR